MKLRFLGPSGTNLNPSALSDAAYLEGKIKHKKPDEPIANPTELQLFQKNWVSVNYSLHFPLEDI